MHIPRERERADMIYLSKKKKTHKSNPHIEDLKTHTSDALPHVLSMFPKQVDPTSFMFLTFSCCLFPFGPPRVPPPEQVRK